MEFCRESFNHFAVEYAIGFYEEARTLSSGRKSHWYVNWRDVSNDLALLEILADYVNKFTIDLDLKPDCYYGVPEGATKLGLLAQFKLASNSNKYDIGTHCMAMGRAKPKNHGEPKDRYFIGEPKGKTIILEDVTTTGKSLMNEIMKIFELNNSKGSSKKTAEIIQAISLTDRMESINEEFGCGISKRESVKNALAMVDVPYCSMSNARELLPLAYDRYKPIDKTVRAIEQEYEKYGITSIKLR